MASCLDRSIGVSSETVHCMTFGGLLLGTPLPHRSNVVLIWRCSARARYEVHSAAGRPSQQHALQSRCPSAVHCAIRFCLFCQHITADVPVRYLLHGGLYSRRGFRRPTRTHRFDSFKRSVFMNYARMTNCTFLVFLFTKRRHSRTFFCH